MEELVTLDCLFIDGTKIEANANKYSFVWKKATEKFSAKTSRTDNKSIFKKKSLPLSIKLSNWIHKSLSPQSSCLHSLKSLKKNWQNWTKTLRRHPLKGKMNVKSRVVNSRKSCVKSKMIFQYVLKNMRTNQEIFEGRNSFSKTDTDATFYADEGRSYEKWATQSCL